MAEHLSPEQEARLRRLLARSRHDERVPDDVAEHLDGVLARLEAGDPELTGPRARKAEVYALAALLGAVMEHYQSGQPVIDEGQQQASGHAEHTGEDGEIVNQIKELLDSRVRPAVAQDGGDITFHGFDRGVVYLHMQGACAGCPSSTLTLKMGIENLLRHYIPEVTEVRPVAV